MTQPRRRRRTILAASPPPPEPIPDPVADFTWTPANPTTDDRVTFDASPSTPAEHIDRYSWLLMMGGEGNSYDQPWTTGPFAAGNVVVELGVRLADGRTARRQRGFVVAAA
jgi:hypothetical protein